MRIPSSIYSQKSASIEIGEVLHKISSISSLDYLRGREISSILETIIELVKEMVRASAGGIMLYNKETEELVLQKPAFGVDEELVNLYRVPVSGGGNAAGVFLSGKPYLSNDAQSDPIIIQRFVEIYKITNIITVPLQVEQKRIGVLHVLNKKGGFSVQDLQVMQLISYQLASLLQNAKLIQELDENKKTTDKLLVMQNDLVQMIVQGKGIPGVVELISEQFDSPVMLEDIRQRLLSSSFRYLSSCPYISILQEESVQNARLEALASLSTARLTHPRHGVKTHYLTPVHREQEVLGFLHVIEENRKLEPVDLETIQRISAALAMEMFYWKNDRTIERRAREEWLCALISKDAKLEPPFFKQAKRWEIDLESSLLLVVKSSEEIGSVSLEEGFLEVIYPSLKKELDCKLYSLTKEDELTCVLPIQAEPSIKSYEEKLHSLMMDCIRICIAKGWPFSIFYSSPCSHVRDYSREYGKIQRCIYLQQKLGKKNWVTSYASLGLYSLLIEIHNDEVLHEFYTHMLGSLIRYDREHGTDLIKTLYAYITENGNLKETARRLFVHVNSVKYRLQRIEQLSQINLNRSEERLQALLALKMLDMYEPTLQLTGSHPSSFRS